MRVVYISYLFEQIFMKYALREPSFILCPISPIYTYTGVLRYTCLYLRRPRESTYAAEKRESPVLRE